MSDTKTRRALKNYVDTASNLAESVKKNLQKDGCIDDKTVLALNEFVVAANAIADLTDELRKDNIKYN